MEANGIAGLVAAIVIAFIIKVFNIITEWLSKLLDVKAPEPIPGIRDSLDHSGLGAVRSQQTPEAPSTAAPEHPESPSQHP